MALQRLLGIDFGGSFNYTDGADYHNINLFTGVATGVAKQFRVYNRSGLDVEVKGSLHLQSTGALLRSISGQSANEDGWNTLSMADTAITQSIQYYLGYVSSAESIGGLEGGVAAGVSEYYKASTYSSHSDPDPISIGTFQSYPDYALGIQLWGYVPPTVSAYSPATGALSGLNFEDAKGAGKLELCNSATYASATVKTEQSTGSWADDAIASTPSFTGLTGGSTAYVFITTASGQINATGYSFTVPASSDITATGSGQSPELSQGTGTASVGSDISATGAGQSPTIGQGTGSATIDLHITGSGQSPIVGSGNAPLVEYTVNEATSGAGDGTVVDHAADPEDLGITYGGAYPAYANDANGTGLNFGTARTYGMGAFNGPLDIGHKVFDALNGSKAVTFETVVKLPSAALGEYDIGNLFVLMQDNGYGCECGLWFWEEAGSQNFEMSFIDQDCTGANFWSHYYIRHASMAAYWGQRVTLHFVIDTANATEEDRMRFYINGTRATLSRTGGHTGINVPQNVEIKITRPTEAPGLDGSTTDAPVYICAGGTPEYHAGSGTMRGEFRQGAIYDLILSDSEITSRTLVLAANDDLAFSGAHEATAGINLSATGSGQSPDLAQGTAVASIDVGLSGAGQEAGFDGGTGAVAIHVTEIGSGQDPVIVGGDAGVDISLNVTGAGQEPAVEQGEASAQAGGSVSASGAGQSPTVGQGTAEVDIHLDAIGAGQEPTIEQGAAGSQIDLSVSGAGQELSPEGGDAETAVPLPALVGGGQDVGVEQGGASVSVSVPMVGAGAVANIEQGTAAPQINLTMSGADQDPVVEFGGAGTNLNEKEPGITIMGKTRTLKFGFVSTLRFNIPALWDAESITEIAVAVTNSQGAVLDSGTLVLPTATTLSAAVEVEAMSITLPSGSLVLAPGDRVRVGGTGEIAEVRTVHSYNSSTRTAIVSPEFEFSHASGAAVIPMWGAYSLDMTDTAVFKNMMDVWCRFTADSQDPSEVYQCQIVKDAFATSGLWDDFEVLYPTEWTVIQSRDLQRMERIAIGQLRDDLGSLDMKLDAIQDVETIQRGLVLKLRLMALMSGGDMSEVEYKRTQEAYTSWLKATARAEIFEDADGDQVMDANENNPTAEFFASQRFF